MWELMFECWNWFNLTVRYLKWRHSNLIEDLSRWTSSEVLHHPLYHRAGCRWACCTLNNKHKSPYINLVPLRRRPWLLCLCPEYFSQPVQLFAGAHVADIRLCLYLGAGVYRDGRNTCAVVICARRLLEYLRDGRPRIVVEAPGIKLPGSRVHRLLFGA